MLFRMGFAVYTVEALCDVGLAEVFYFAPVFILGNDSYLKTFTVDQLNALALLSLNVYGFAGSFSTLFFDLASIFLGYLMYRSGYLPRALGVIWIISGVLFMLSTYAAVLTPAYDSPLLRLPTIITFVLTTLWLFVRGIDVPKWSRLSAGQSAVLG